MLQGWGGKFHGKQKFTRYEMATVLTRYMKKYNAERERVEGELDDLRVEDGRQRGQIQELYGKTEDLESRMASLDGQEASASNLRPSQGDGTLASAVASQLNRPVQVTPQVSPPVRSVRPPESPVVQAPLAPLPEASSPDSLPVRASQEGESLQHQIARLRARMEARQRAREGLSPRTQKILEAESSKAPTLAPTTIPFRPDEEDLPSEDLQRLQSIRQRFMKEMKLRMEMSGVSEDTANAEVQVIEKILPGVDDDPEEEDPGHEIHLPMMSLSGVGYRDQL
jgi:hypothetical protein